MTLYGRQDAAVLRGLAAADPAGSVLRRMRPHDICGAHVYHEVYNNYKVYYNNKGALAHNLHVVALGNWIPILLGPG